MIYQSIFIRWQKWDFIGTIGHEILHNDLLLDSFKIWYAKCCCWQGSQGNTSTMKRYVTATCSVCGLFALCETAEPERISMPILKIPVKHYLGIVSQSQQKDLKKRFRKRAEETHTASTSSVRRYLNKWIANDLLFCCSADAKINYYYY